MDAAGAGGWAFRVRRGVVQRHLDEGAGVAEPCPDDGRVGVEVDDGAEGVELGSAPVWLDDFDGAGFGVSGEFGFGPAEGEGGAGEFGPGWWVGGGPGVPEGGAGAVGVVGRAGWVGGFVGRCLAEW